MAASVSSGRPVFSRGAVAVIRAVFAASDAVKSTTSSAAAPSLCSAAAEFGLTVMTGVPVVTVAVTV
jgi:hypothetical protein